jgi:hypothetical protein
MLPFVSRWRRDTSRTATYSGYVREAADAYRRGIEVAERRGDQQAAKEMRVFLKRITRTPDNER